MVKISSDMTKEELTNLTDEEFDELWNYIKECDEQREKEYEALPEEEKKRLEKIYSDGFYERISDDVFGSDFGED